MSESLRDQLLKAGFSQSKKDNPPKSSKSTQSKSTQSKSTQSKSANTTAKESGQARKSTGTSRVFKAGSASKAEQRQRYRGTQSVRSDGQAASGTRKKAKKAPAIKPRSGTWSTRSAAGAKAVDNKPAKQTDESGSSDKTQSPTIQGKDAIEKLITENTLRSCEGDQTYRFTLQNRIREITTNEQTRQKLSEAELGIAAMNSGLHIVPASVVRKIRELNAQWDAFLAQDDSAKAGSGTPADDASGYDDFPIPDDLIW